MALPAGITPKTVTVGIASFFDGSLADGTVTITAPVNVVHTPTNNPVFSSVMTQKFVNGIAQFNLCPTDAPGLNRVDWTYVLRVTINGALVQPDPVWFTLPTAGPDTVDLDSLVTVPSSAGVPISATVVTSVNGQTGDVTVAGGTGGAVVDATASVKGVVKLAGDLGGTAASPTVPGLAGKANTSHTHGVTDLTATGTKDSTTFLRGDNTWAVPAGSGGGGGGGSTLAVAATVSASGTLLTGMHNPVNATSGTRAMSLPTGAAAGTLLAVEKTDATANTVTVTGNVRGAAGTVLTLFWQNEALLLAADTSGSWWPIAGHKTKTSLDAAYDAAGAATTARAFAIQRANHTGTQAIGTVTGLQTALDAKLDSTAAASTYVAKTDAIDLESTQDSIAGMFTGGTHSGISFAYNDPGNVINATVTPGAVADATTTSKGAVQLAGDLAGTAAAPTVAKLNGTTPAAVATSGSYTDLTNKPTIPAAYTDEQAQDAAAALFTGGAHTGISFAYDDAGNVISATVTGGGSNTSTPSLTYTSSPGMVPCATGVHWGQQSDGVNNSANARTSHKVLFGVDEIRLVYAAALNDNLNGLTQGDTATITAGVEDPFGAISPVTFDGQAKGLLSWGGILVSDPIAASFPSIDNAGTSFNYFWVRTHIVAGTSGKYPCGIGSDYVAHSGEGFEYGASLADKALTGTITTATPNLNAPRPSLIIGTPTTAQPKLIAAYGDSITNGQSDLANDATPGYPARALQAASLPFVKLGYPSQKIPDTRTKYTVGDASGNTQRLLLGATHMIAQHGVNNLNPTLGTPDTVAAVQVLWLRYWGYWKRRGMKVWQTTLTPHTTSTDAFATTANQAINNTTENTSRVALNDWLRDGAPIDATALTAVAVGTATNVVRAGAATHPLAGYFEIADRAESARNSGIWKAGYTNDGIHPVSTAAAALAGGIDVTKFV